jgi:septum formation protein
MQLPWPVVLASASPRRQELLKQIIERFAIEVADIHESPMSGESPWETAERLAQGKGRAVFARRPEALIIAGDTVVAIPDGNTHVQLAKPTDAGNAKEMLRMLSGREHLVITGVCLIGPSSEDVFSDTTHVTFRELSDEEITRYVATGEPMDKAGAYAIQGGAKEFVSKCEGSISNVIGFPLEAIRDRIAMLV